MSGRDDYERWLRGGVQSSRRPYRLPDPPFYARVGDKDVLIDAVCVYGGLTHYSVPGFGLIQAHQIAEVKPFPANDRRGHKPVFHSVARPTPTARSAPAEYKRRCLNTRDWLQAQLSDGQPKPVTAIAKQAETDHIPWRGIERAKKRLKIRSFKRGGINGRNGAQWLWQLP